MPMPRPALSFHAIDRLGDEVIAAAAAAGPGVTPWTLDLADAPAVESCLAAIEARAGRIDILVNNAGIIFFRPI